MANRYISPTGNPEVWLEKPEGYYTPEEWAALHPPEPKPQPTIEEMRKKMEAAVEEVVNSKIRELGYDNLTTVTSYAVSEVREDWQAECRAIIDWRVAVWEKCIEVQDAVLAGEMAAPTIGALLAMLPGYRAPEAQEPTQ